MSQLLVDRQKWEAMVKSWAECIRLETENARLKAEVERLTKAGDAMAEEMLKLNHPHASVYFWCKAKEGGQP